MGIVDTCARTFVSSLLSLIGLALGMMYGNVLGAVTQVINRSSSVADRRAAFLFRNSPLPGLFRPLFHAQSGPGTNEEKDTHTAHDTPEPGSSSAGARPGLGAMAGSGRLRRDGTTGDRSEPLIIFTAQLGRSDKHFAEHDVACL